MAFSRDFVWRRSNGDTLHRRWQLENQRRRRRVTRRLAAFDDAVPGARGATVAGRALARGLPGATTSVSSRSRRCRRRRATFGPKSPRDHRGAGTLGCLTTRRRATADAARAARHGIARAARPGAAPARGGRFGGCSGSCPRAIPAQRRDRRARRRSSRDDGTRRRTRHARGLHVPRAVRRPRHHVRPDLQACSGQRPARARQLPHAALRPRLAVRLGPDGPAVSLRLARDRTAA